MMNFLRQVNNGEKKRLLGLVRRTVRKHRPPGRIIECAWTSIRPGIEQHHYHISVQLAAVVWTWQAYRDPSHPGRN